MITQHEITGTAWVAISGAGESGTCWIESATTGNAKIRLYHSTLGVPDLSKKSHGYPIFMPNSNFDAVQLKADGVTDVYYAICDDVNTKVLLNVDMA